MARNPDDRPKSMGDLSYQIHLVETSLVMTPSPTQVPASTDRSGATGNSQGFFAEVSSTHIVPPPSNRNRNLLIGAGVLASLTLGGGIVYALRPPAPPLAVVAAPDPVPPSPSDTLPNTTAKLDVEPGTSPAATGPTPDPEPDPEPTLAHEPRRDPRQTTPKIPPQPPKAQTQELEQLAGQLLHAQRYAEAADAYKKLLGIKNKRGLALTGLAQISFQAKNYKEAAERAKNAVRAGGGLESHLLMGDAYFKLEKFEDAKKAYSEALKIAPNNPIARQNLQLIEKRSN